MKKQLNQVAAFQQGFGLTFNESPVNLPISEGELRFSLLKEENEEYLEAVEAGDLLEVADALGDQLYLVLGSIISHGMQDVITEVFNAIHDSNMSKLDENGKPIINGQNGVAHLDKPIGKVIKSVNYFKPSDRIKKALNL
jgi:predicted HAD superfamily Cof-like phosphohydrolase